MQPTYWRSIDHIIGAATADDFDTIGQKETREAIESFVLEYSDRSTRLLDVGCNTGVEGYRLFQRNFPGLYIGIDSNAKALGYAMVNLSGHPASVALADASSLPYPDESFDIVLSKDVIEHAEHYGEILKELARVARQRVILSMFIRPHDLPDEIRREPQGFHHNRYNRDGIYSLMRGSGFGQPSIIHTGQPGHSGFQDEVLVFERLPLSIRKAISIE